MAAADSFAFFWDALPARYRVILCDVWGVIHDGVRLEPGVVARLQRWRGEGRFVLLITNAPRPADVVAKELQRMGLPQSCWDAIETSGEAGIQALNGLGVPVGFLGTRDDRPVVEAHGLNIAMDDGFADLACVGLEEARPYVADYEGQMLSWAERGVRLHCLNPDRVVMRGEVAEACAGALADRYQDLGGPVVWYGKPHAAIYRQALHLAGNPPLEDVLAIGDGLKTDMLGAARLGIDAVFVRGGVHDGVSFPDRFAVEHGLGDWRPIASVGGLE